MKYYPLILTLAPLLWEPRRERPTREERRRPKSAKTLRNRARNKSARKSRRRNRRK